MRALRPLVLLFGLLLPLATASAGEVRPVYHHGYGSGYGYAPRPWYPPPRPYWGPPPRRYAPPPVHWHGPPRPHWDGPRWHGPRWHHHRRW
jgi:hypothetical protein